MFRIGTSGRLRQMGAKLEWHFAEKATQEGFKDFLKESAQGKELLKKVELIFTPAKKKK